MSTKTKTPKASKKTAEKPSKKREIAAGFIFQVPTNELSDLPELADIPTLEQAAALDTENAGASGDWYRLGHNMRAAGRIREPLHVVKQADGKWAVADGRSRRAWAAILIGEGDQRFASCPCVEVAAEEAESLALASLHRRMAPEYVIAYMGTLKHEGQLTSRGRGRPSKEVDMSDAVTQHSLAAEYGVAQSLVAQCVSALRHFQNHPADRKRDEPRILAGLMSPERVIHAATGRAATAGNPRRPTSYQSWLPKLKSFTSTIRTYEEWSAESKANALEALKDEISNWPLEFCGVLSETLQANETLELEAAGK